MDKYPIFLHGEIVGELTAAREPPYLRLSASCTLSTPEVVRLFAVGDRGRLRVGVLEPSGGALTISRKLPLRQTEELGNLLRGELSSTQREDEAVWQPVTYPQRLFRTAFLQEQLRGIEGALTRTDGGMRLLALPFDCHHPFLLTSLFCFACIRTIHGVPYAVFAFDRGENPVFWSSRA